ncbi:hypothetical protein MBLNU13_g03392t1 [Cladosporium sp. NU13]
MLSSGTKAVPSPACLRCQLRRVLQHLRPPPATNPRPFAAHRPFSTTYSRHIADDSGARPPARENTSGVYFKQFGPAGRIVGKRGRKQRQTSEALATNSLGEKSEIVVFRDIPQARRKSTDKKEGPNYEDIGEASLKDLSLTPEEIQAALSGTGQTPDEEEVTKSIDALRPQAPVIEDNEFELLIKELLNCYNLKQLSRYLSQSLKSHHTSTTVVRELQRRGNAKWGTPQPRRTITFTRSRWQPGRTPLDVRRTSAFPAPSQSRGRPSGSKATAADRIVRVAWEVTKRTDEQKVGELEVEMTPWALAMFFDVAYNRVPKYQTLIEPPLLLRRSEIQPYRRDNIIRITARRQDADEIATQLENKVLLIGKQVVQIDDLIPSSAATYPKGQSLQHFSQQDLNDISRRTQSVFMQQKDGSIGIYSFKQSDRINARRLLLSLLDLPSHNTTRVMLDPLTDPQVEAGSFSLALVPVFPDRGLHFRDRSKSFARTVLPARREMPPAITVRSFRRQAELMSRKILSLVKDFEQQKEEEPVAVAERPPDSSMFWAGKAFKASQTWWVHLGLLLQESTPNTSGLLFQDKSLVATTDDNTQDLPKQESVFWRQVPGYETLLSYFEPNSRPGPTVDGDPGPEIINRKSTIVAHFTPSPFSQNGAKALDLFPRLELTVLRKYNAGSEETELKIDGLRAISGEDHVDIPLPHRVVDLRLTRKIGAHANMAAVLADPEIQRFVAALKESANSKGPLHGTSEVTFKMPGWMVETDGDIRKAQDGSLPEIAVPYLFERFEQVQSTGFKKDAHVLDKRAEHSEAVRNFNASFSKHARLQYSEIEAGDTGGRQTEISFKVHKPKDQPAQPSKELEADQSEDTQLLQHDNALRNMLVSALAIADFVTRACKNEVTIWRRMHGSNPDYVPNAEAEASNAEGDEHAETIELDAETRNEDGETKKEARSDDGLE